jgi:hypothetical protein
VDLQGGLQLAYLTTIQSNPFDAEFFEEFKIQGDLEKVVKMKSVPNWISNSKKLPGFLVTRSYFN